MMKRTTVDGKTLNQRTADMLAMWQFNALTDFYVLQGSYNAGGVKTSAGTHDGGGALDISTYNLGDLKNKRWVVKQGRLAGFMAYLRPYMPNVWTEHIHAGAIGDAEASSGLKAQFAEYYAGGDGLVGNAPDPGPRLKRIFVWNRVPQKRVSLLGAYRQFKAKTPKKSMTVARIQWVLNEKLGTDLPVDGIAGPKTRAAYKKWEVKCAAPSSDGIPGKYSLTRLGEGRFKVNTLTWEQWRAASKTREAARKTEEIKPTVLNHA